MFVVVGVRHNLKCINLVVAAAQVNLLQTRTAEVDVGPICLVIPTSERLDASLQVSQTLFKARYNLGANKIVDRGR